MPAEPAAAEIVDRPYKFPASPIFRYGIALASVAVAVYVRLIFDPFLGNNLALITLYGAVAFSVWMGRWRPAALAALVGFLLLDYFVVEPRHQFVFEAPALVGFLLYVLSCSAIIYTGEMMHRAADRVTEEILERKGVESTAAGLHQRLFSLVEASGSLLASPRVEDVLPATLRVAHNLLAADGYAVWRRGQAGVWHIVSSNGLSDGFLSQVIETGTEKSLSTVPFSEPLAVESIGEVPFISHRAEVYASEGIQSLLIVPIAISGSMTGTLVFYYRSRHAFTDLETQTARALGNLAATALTTAELYDEQRHSREELRAAQLRLSQIIDSVPGVVWEAWGKPDSSNQRIDYVSQSVERMLGYSVEEWLGTPNFWLTIVHPEDREKAAAVSARAFATGESHVNEFRWVAKDGRVLCMEAHANVIRNAAGHPIGMRGITFDVTERKRTEQALAEGARRQSSMYELVGRLHRADSLKEVYDAALDALANALRCDRSAILLYDEGNAMRFVAWRGLSDAYRRAVEGHSPWEREDPNPRPVTISDIGELQGELRPVVRAEGIGALTFIPLVANGRLIGKFMTYYNAPHVFTNVELEISESIARQLALSIQRRRAETARARLAAIVESSDDAIISMDLNGIVTSWNGAAERLYGYKAQEILNRPIATVIPGERQNEEQFMLSRIRRGETVEHYETVRRRKDGQLFDVSITVSPVRNDRGEIIGSSKIGRDITERKRIERDREMLLETEKSLRVEAETTGRMKDEFLATISHELRTPLNAIMGWASLLRKGLDQDSDPKNTLPYGLEVIERNARTQAELIEDLLDMSRIISGKLQLDVRPIQLTPVVKAAMDAVRPAAEAKKISLNVSIDSGAELLRADEARLQQIIWNLLSNSVKFTPNGGSVWVSAARAGEITEISVKDTGAGIGPEFLPYVFDRFRQADASMTRKHGGLGLGLSIVRHLVEIHGGTITAESEGADRGSTFTVRLPVGDFAQTGLEPELAFSESMTGTVLGYQRPYLAGVKVLAMDDEPDTREMLNVALRKFGADVRTTSSAGEAFQVLQTWKPDIMVCDIGMPEENGYSFMQRVRRLAPGLGGNTPAVALTGYARNENRLRALQVGFQTFVPKPIEPAELAKTMAALVRMKQ